MDLLTFKWIFLALGFVLFGGMGIYFLVLAFLTRRKKPDRVGRWYGYIEDTAIFFGMSLFPLVAMITSSIGIVFAVIWLVSMTYVVGAWVRKWDRQRSHDRQHSHEAIKMFSPLWVASGELVRACLFGFGVNSILSAWYEVQLLAPADDSHTALVEYSFINLGLWICITLALTGIWKHRRNQREQRKRELQQQLVASEALIGNEYPKRDNHIS